MRPQPGSWIKVALGLVKATADMDPRSRRNHVRVAASELGIAERTLHRHMVAARWVATRGRTYVPLEKVVSAFTAVEALQRLEEARPAQAEKVAEDVLLNRLTSRQIMALAAMTKSTVRNKVWQPGPFDVMVIDDIAPLLPRGKAQLFSDDASFSEVGPLLKVDVEWLYETGERAAVFLSPQIIYSQHKSLHDTWCACTTARSFYERVLFFSYDAEEAHFIQRHQPTKSLDIAPLVVHPVEAD